MNRPIEDLLRQAYQAKVEPITEQRLSQLSDARADAFAAELASDTLDTGGLTRFDTGVIPGPARSRAHSRWFAPMLAAASVLVLAGGALTLARTHVQHTAEPAPPASHISSPLPTPSGSKKPSGSSGTSASPDNHGQTGAPVLLGNGVESDRSHIPWSQVGPGWTIAQWTPDAELDDQRQVVLTSPQNIYLVNPIGGRYLITSIAAGRKLRLQDWSGDGRRALFLQDVSVSKAVLVVLDLQTGDEQQFTEPSSVSSATFTKPMGKAILVSMDDNLERVDLTGTLQLRYPQAVHDVSLGSVKLYSPDGTLLVFGSGTSGMLVLNNDGTYVRTLTNPAGYTDCQPLRWWDTDTILAHCRPVSGLAIRPFLIPLSGDAATALVTDPSQLSVDTAWQVGSVTLAGISPHTAPCAPADLATVQPDGTIVPLKITTAIGGKGAYLLGATSTTVQLMSVTDCNTNSAIVSHDPSTHTFTTLLGGSVNGGSIVDALDYRSSDPVG